MSVELRESKHEDIPILFEQQNDPGAHKMVGITSHAPDDRDAYFKKWDKIFTDDNVIARTILYNGEIAGMINSFFAPWSEKQEIGYWLGRKFWGKGIASKALELFLEIEEQRPIYATASTHNKASVIVLERNGFEIIGKKTVAVPRTGKEIEEFSFRLK